MLLEDTPSTSTEDMLVAADFGRQLLEEALAPVNQDLKILNERLPGYLTCISKSSKDVVQHIFSAGGKRIRPALYFMCCRMLGYEGDHFYSIGAVSEYVHTASLLHDDVVDNSSIRRNKPTANSIWGDETSVLVGDLIYATASELMAATGNMEIVTGFARAIRMMSEGELLQLEQLYNPNITEATYMQILECKTAVLVATSCRAAGLLAGCSTELCERLSLFGHFVGMAFQLIDDALDYVGSSDVVGKATLADLAEGKVTLPVILLREHASKEEWQKLTAALAQDGLTSQQITEVADLVHKYDTASMTLSKAHDLTDKAMAQLSVWPESPEKESLINLANKLLMRFQ